MRKYILGSLAAALLATPVAAASPMDLAVIDRAVANFTGAQTGKPGGAKLPVDRRLRLSQCSSPLDLQWFGRDRGSVQVSCPSAGWKIYVAVDNQAGAGFSRGANDVGEPMIKRGESVSILIRGKGFTLTRKGSAVEDGALGEWIKIRAVGDKRKTLRAMVLQPGQVGMELP